MKKLLVKLPVGTKGQEELGQKSPQEEARSSEQVPQCLKTRKAAGQHGQKNYKGQQVGKCSRKRQKLQYKYVNSSAQSVLNSSC